MYTYVYICVYVCIRVGWRAGRAGKEARFQAEEQRRSLLMFASSSISEAVTSLRLPGSRCAPRHHQILLVNSTRLGITPQHGGAKYRRSGPHFATAGAGR